MCIYNKRFTSQGQDQEFCFFFQVLEIKIFIQLLLFHHRFSLCYFILVLGEKEVFKRLKLSSFTKFINIQKQPPRGVPRKRCSENMQQIYMRKPMPKCDFEITLRHGCSHLLHFFRTLFLKNTSGWLLLNISLAFGNK